MLYCLSHQESLYNVHLYPNLSMPTFQMVVDVSLLSSKSLWVLLLLTTSFVFGRFSCHLICTPLNVGLFFLVTHGFFTYSPSCCTSKHNLTCTFLMKSSKRKTLASQSTQFSKNFTFLRTCWRGFVKSACVWNRLYGPHEQGKHCIYYCLFSWCSLSLQRKALKYLLIWITDTFPTKPYQKERV